MEQGKGRVHRALKLAHHRHTARPLPHHHTSYRALFVVLAMSGLTMATIQYASADDYSVQATVPNGSYTLPAVITSPTDGTVVSDPNVQLKGTCEMVTSGTFVVIKRGTSTLGTAVCQPDSTFAMNVTLDLGANVLLPTELSGAATNGPDGAAVTITYTPPPPPPPTPQPTPGTTTPPSAPTTTTPPPLVIQPQGPPLIERTTDKIVTIVFSVTNGYNPYVIVADWGDGKIDTVHVQSASDTVKLSHVYDTPGAYTIVLNATDSRGNKATYQYVAVAQAGALSLVAPGATIVPPTLSSSAFGSWATLTRIVWTAYGLLSFTVIALWFMSPTHTLLARPVLATAKARIVRAKRRR